MWRQEGPQGSSDPMDDVTWVPSPKGPEYTKNDLRVRISP